MDRPDIIVIGAGLAGLCSAALLARAGHRVRVLEQGSHAGGRARSRREAGFIHNIGAHALYARGPAQEVLQSLGIALRGGQPRGEGGYLLQGERLEHLPRGPLTLLTSGALDTRGKLSFARVMLSLGERKARSMRGRSVREWLEADVPDARTRALLEAFVRLTTYAHAPEHLGADVAIRQLRGALEHGVLYLDGGWQTLVDAASARARELGVQIELDSAVARIEYAQHGARAAQVTAVVTQRGQRLPVSSVVAALDPRALAALVPDDAHARRWVDTCVPLRVACLDLGVRALAHPERTFVMASDAPLYFSNHSAFAALAPEGGHALHLVRYLAPGEDGRDKEAELRAFLERIQPGAYVAAEALRFMPNLTVHNDVPGSARAGTAHPAIAGLHLVGDWVNSSAMLLDGVLASVREVVARVGARDAATREVVSGVEAREARQSA